MAKKYYYDNYISNVFNRKTKDNKIDILYEALDYMQSYNGRSRLDCVALAMGFTYTTDDNNEECYIKEVNNG